MDAEKIIKYRNECDAIVNCYLNLLNEVQNQIFTSINGVEKEAYQTFYNLSNLEDKIRLCSILSSCYKNDKFPSVNKLLHSWSICFNQISKCDKKIKKSVAHLQIPRLIAGICLLEGKYYEAIGCMWDILILCDWKDQLLYNALIRWAFFTGELDLIEHCLSQEIAIPMTEGQEFLIATYRKVLKFYKTKSEANQKEVLSEFALQLNNLAKDDGRRSYDKAYTTAILRNTLVNASRLPNADINMIGDPIFNRFSELTDLKNIAESRFKPLYLKHEQPLALYEKISSPREFFLICSAIADHLECANLYVRELIEVGLMRDAEIKLLDIWCSSLSFGIPYRVLQPLSLFYYIKKITIYEPQMRIKISRCINALLTPDTISYGSSCKNILRNPNKDQHSSVEDFEDSIIITSYAAEIDHLSETFADITTNDVKNCPERHAGNCKCGICKIASDSWHFSLLMQWINLITNDFSIAEFEKFRTWNDSTKKRIKETRKDLLKTVGLSANANSSYIPLQLVNIYIDSSVNFLTRQYQSVNSQNKYYQDQSILEMLDKKTWTKYLNDAIKLCIMYPLTNFAAYLLLLHFKQLRLENNADLLQPTTSDDAIICERLKNAYSLQKNYGHLLFREWRRTNCLYLARNWVTRPMHQAQFYFEATIPSVIYSEVITLPDFGNDIVQEQL